MDAWRDRERALRGRGHEVRLLSARVWDEAGALVPLEPRPGEDVEGARTWGSHPALFLYDPRPVWRALGETWDVVDIHEEPFALATAEVLLLRALRRNRAPFTLYSAQNLAKRYPPPFRWLEWHALRHAAGVSVCSTEAGRIVEAKGFPGRASFIPLGTDTAHFRPGSRPAPTGQPPLTVGYAGRLAAHKGVDVLLEAAALDDRILVRVAGAGPDEATLRALADRLGLAERVRFLGSVVQGELPDFYRGLDVLAVPSRTTPGWVEQFGRVAVEAMACGTPVVASSSGALPDVVGGAGVLVREGDPAELAKALLEVGLDPVRAQDLRRAAVERARTCDWEAVADRYLDLYARATHTTPSATASALPGAAPARRPLEVVVVAYHSPDLLAEAVTPVRHLPVTVVDNSSSPAVRDVCDSLGVRYLDPGRNGGFAAGVNHGLAHRLVPGADLLLLNPDAVISTADIETLQHALLADPRLASVGPAQIDGSGHESRVGWPFPSPGRTWLEALGLGRLGARTAYAIGSVLLLRAEALAQVGGLDERFFLYAEETDWAYRAHLLGWGHAVVSAARATHVGAATSSDPTRRDTHFHASQEKYVRKHFGATGWQVARAGQVVGAAVRSLVLPGDRGRQARRRLRLFVTGPVRAEQRYAVRTG